MGGAPHPHSEDARKENVKVRQQRQDSPGNVMLAASPDTVLCRLRESVWIASFGKASGAGWARAPSLRPLCALIMQCDNLRIVYPSPLCSGSLSIRSTIHFVFLLSDSPRRGCTSVFSAIYPPKDIRLHFSGINAQEYSRRVIW